MISCEQLKKLYLDKKLSSYEIASLLHLSQSWIMSNLRKCAINTRKISEAKVLTRPWYKRKNFSGNQREKAYMIGFRIGDLYINQTSPRSRTIRATSNSTITEQRILFKKIFRDYGHIWEGKPDKKGAVFLRCYLNRSFDFLLPKKDHIENWILKNKKYFLEFLGGYIDAEGTFSVGKNKVFALSSQDKNIIHQIYKKLDDFSIKCNKPILTRIRFSRDKNGVLSNKNVWTLKIYKRSTLLKFIELIESFIRHGKRKKDMISLKSSLLSS